MISGPGVTPASDDESDRVRSSDPRENRDALSEEESEIPKPEWKFGGYGP